MTTPRFSLYSVWVGSLAEKKEQFLSQIHELQRLADEAQACAQLLRQQAEEYQKVLDKVDVSAEELDALLAQRTKPELPVGAFRLTEGLM